MQTKKLCAKESAPLSKLTPIAVIISDVHYSLNTLEIADLAMRQAILRANSLGVPLIIAGDLTDNKANMRAEVVNQMLETFRLCKTTAYILRGNHDQINEKSEEHSLNFLGELMRETEESYSYDQTTYIPYVKIVDTPQFTNDFSFGLKSPWLIPYHHDIEVLKKVLTGVERGSLVIMHQGITGSISGDYIQDKSAITVNDVHGLRVISGHYHTRQDIQLPDGGLWSYVGNPFTLNFGEVNDPDKGFRILNSDGTLDFVPTKLRKHVILDITLDGKLVVPVKSFEDIGLARVRGTKEQLARFNSELFKGWRVELIPTETLTKPVNQQQSQPEIIDSLIETLDTDSDQKSRLKLLWKDL